MASSAHFGFLDETLNRDLDDIAATFAAGAFFVATIDGAIAGTGGLHVQADGTANIVRMSTAKSIAGAASEARCCKPHR